MLKKNKVAKWAIGTACFLLVGLLVAFSIVKAQSEKRFAAGTILNGIDVSNMTLEQLNKQIGQYSIEVIQRDKEGNEYSETIPGQDFGIGIGGNEKAAEKVLQAQGVWQYLSGGGKEYTLKGWLAYDEGQLKEAVRRLSCFDRAQAVQPKNAHISEYNAKKGAYQIVPEKNGNILKEEKAERTVREAILQLKENVNLSKEDCYQTAKIKKGNKKLKKTLNRLNTYVGTTITYHFGKKKEVVDGKKISKWIKMTGMQKITFQKEKIEKFVAKLHEKYDTIYGTRKFKTSYGNKVTVVGGDYGWWMNCKKEEEELLKQIKAGKSGRRTPEYYQTAVSYGKKDYGNSYIEVDLTGQRVFLYVNGKKIVETSCVTGNASRGFSTPAGTYSITYTESNATLKGENYATPVKYWMPFNGNIGLHDANWRSQFGGGEYLYNGSHGCVNLPPYQAAIIFQHAKKGMPVICYH